MSWLSRLIGKPKSHISIPSSIELTPELAFLQRAPSVSLLVFRGDVETAIQTWLGNHGWALVERTTLRASFDELYAVARETRSEGKRTQVVKATYRIAGFTVLLDPEMVVMVQDELSELCRDANTEVLGGIWERYSRTVMINEITAGGVKRSSSWIGGERSDEIDPWPEVSGTGPADLVAVMRAAQIPVDQVFGDALDATVLLLAE